MSNDCVGDPSYWFCVHTADGHVPIHRVRKDDHWQTYWYSLVPGQQAEGSLPDCDHAVQFDVRKLPGWVDIPTPPRAPGRFRFDDRAWEAWHTRENELIVETITAAAQAGLL